MVIHCKVYPEMRMDLLMVLPRGMAMHRQRVRQMGLPIEEGCWMTTESVRQRGIHCGTKCWRKRWMDWEVVLPRDLEMCHHYQVKWIGLEIDKR